MGYKSAGALEQIAGERIVRTRESALENKELERSHFSSHTGDALAVPADRQGTTDQDTAGHCVPVWWPGPGGHRPGRGPDPAPGLVRPSWRGPGWRDRIWALPAGGIMSSRDAPAAVTLQDFCAGCLSCRRFAVRTRALADVPFV